MWHYSGTLLYERPWNQQEELWEVSWQNFPDGSFKPPVVNYKPVEGIASTQPQGEQISHLIGIVVVYNLYLPTGGHTSLQGRHNP